MNEEKLKKTVANLMKGTVAKGLLVKRGETGHNSHRWINTRKAGSSVQKPEPLQKMLIIHELSKMLPISYGSPSWPKPKKVIRKDIKKEAGVGSPATVASTGFTPTFGGVQSRSVQKRVAAQKGLPYPDFDKDDKPKVQK